MPGKGKRNWNPSVELMKNRMWDYTSREEYISNIPHLNYTVASEGLPQQNRILRTNGGFNQQDRMIFDKRRSLDRALMYSYQGANIQKVVSSEDEEQEFNPICRALINPNKLKQDYDDKILSVHKEMNFKPGDVFKWLNTNTYWLILLQDLTELAYFRGDIRKCSYQIDWLDEDGKKQSTYAAIRGPVETKIDYIQKHKISVDNPNYSLHILLPKNEHTLKYFQRYSKFYLQDEEVMASQVCWRVEAIDWVSTPGILEINAVEYYSNTTEDDVEKGLVGGLVVKEPELLPEKGVHIDGEQLIKPKLVYDYKFTGFSIPASWTISDPKAPVKIEVDEKDDRIVHIQWLSVYSGKFTLSLGEYTKEITVQSLF